MADYHASVIASDAWREIRRVYRSGQPMSGYERFGRAIGAALLVLAWIGMLTCLAGIVIGAVILAAGALR